MIADDAKTGSFALTKIISPQLIKNIKNILKIKNQNYNSVKRDGDIILVNVIDPVFVDVIRSWSVPISVLRVGWYPTADGIRPKSADTSEPACTKL